MVALSRVVSSEPTKDHNDPGEYRTMYAVPSATMTVVVRMVQEETLECFGE